MDTWHASVFALVPKSRVEEEFVFVRDQKESGSPSKGQKRKLPGGGVSSERAVEFSGVAQKLGLLSNSSAVNVGSHSSIVRFASAAEVLQEVGLGIDPPRERVVVVHESHKDGAGAHHWYALKAESPISSRLLQRKENELRQKEIDFLAADIAERRTALQEEINAIKKEIDAIRAGWPLEPGEEIAEAEWFSRDDMLARARSGEFFSNHAVAILWKLSGARDAAIAAIKRGKAEVGDFSLLSDEETDKAWEKIHVAVEEDSTVANVFSEMPFKRGIIDYFVDDDGCLIICHYPECEICQHSPADEGVVETPAPALITRLPDGQTKIHFPPRSANVSGNGRAVAPVGGRFTFNPVSAVAVSRPSRPPKPKPVSPADAMVSGEVEVMLLSSDRFEDRILLQRDFTTLDINNRERYPHAVAPHLISVETPTTVAAFVETLDAKTLDRKGFVPAAIAAERHITLSRESGAATLIAVSGKTPPTYLGDMPLVSFSVNEPPPPGFIVGFAHAKTIADALAEFRRVHGLEVHNEWFRLPKEIERKAKVRDAEARSRFENLAMTTSA